MKFGVAFTLTCASKALVSFKAEILEAILVHW